MKVLSRRALLSLAALLPMFALPPVPVSAAQGIILYANSTDAIKDNYIVVLKDSAPVDTRAAALTSAHGGQLRHTFRTALHGFAATMSERAARRLAADPAVAYVQQDGVVHALGTQSPVPSWGLDRIDQARLPLDNSYTFTSAAGVHAYVLDTGIRVTHTSFGGRAVWGVNTTGDGNNSDCNGHGTHVAGVVGGTQYGVAKDVRLVAVKVLGCNGSGSFSSVIAGIDWVTAHAVRPAVANVSLGAQGSNAALEGAMRNSIASGITYVVAAGDSNADACNFTPARVPEAITVSASDIGDNKAPFSNVGRCADLFAPGVNITSSWSTSDVAGNTLSGTSTSAAHVSGAAALALVSSPTLPLPPPQVLKSITSDLVSINNWTTEMAVRKLLITPSVVSVLAPDLRIVSVDPQTGDVWFANDGFSDAVDFWVVLHDVGRRLESYWIARLPGHTVRQLRFGGFQRTDTNCTWVVVDDSDTVAETDELNNRSAEFQPCVK